MDKFIKTQVKDKLNELFVGHHFEERLQDRILSPDNVSVGYELDNTVGKYKVVGTYEVTPTMKNTAMTNYDKLKKTKFGQNKSVAVKILDFWVDPKNVAYSIDPAEAKGRTLVVIDPVTNSNGNWVYAIVRGDKAVTLFFAKSYVKLDARKMDVDYILNKF